MFWVVLLLAAISVPPVFRTVLWGLLHEEVWRQGGAVRVSEIQGSLWAPVGFSGVSLTLPSAGGGRFELEADQVSIECAWSALLDRVGSRRFFERLRLSGGRLVWEMGVPSRQNASGAGSAASLGRPLKWPLPARLELDLKDAALRSGQLAVHSNDLVVSLSELAPGELTAGRIEVHVNGWSKGFREVHGKTSLQAGRVQLGETQLMEGLRISTLTASLSQLAAGRMDFELQAEAFGGEIRVLAQSNSESMETPFEASGTFSKLGVAPLAAFLNVTEAAGGTLEAGKFSFRGQTNHPELGTATLRLEAKNFQWESRQWDSLVLGATLLDHRIQVPEFALRQGHNQLVLNGDMQWPGGEMPWWKADFGVNINARVNNLTELSALLLPEFKYAAGGLTVDGAVRSQAGVLGGALIVSGANLAWRSAPIEELHAAVKLQGSEIQVLSVELTQGADVLRGKGSLHVGEGWSYQGDLHGSVRELAKYAAILQPPVATQPYAGGIDLDWSGKGSAAGHEGWVNAQFRQLHPVQAQEQWPHPMSGGVTGVYNKNGVEFETASLGDEKVEVRMGVSLGGGGVRLSNVKVAQGQSIALEGEALLPVEIWKSWPQWDWSRVLNTPSPMDVRFVSKGLDLEFLGRLPGMPQAITGHLDGEWDMKGSLKSLAGHGLIQLRQAGWALGAGRISEITGDLAWDESTIQARNLEWTSASGRYAGDGALVWKGDSAPQIALRVACDNATWMAPEGLKFPIASHQGGSPMPLSGVSAKGRAEWIVSGPLASPLLKGEVLVKSIVFGGVPDLRLFWREAAPEPFMVRGTENAWMREWKLSLHVSGGDGATVEGTTGAAHVQIQAGGTVGSPDWQGEVRLALRGVAAGQVLDAEPLVLKLVPGQALPEVEIRAHGVLGESAFRANASGSLGHAVREYQADLPLTPETVRGVFEEGKSW